MCLLKRMMFLMEKEHNFSSPFVTILGLIVIFVGVLVANYFNYPALSSFLLFIWLVCFVSNRWGKFSLKKVEVNILPEQNYIFPDSEVNVKYTIKNKKFLPLIWLEILQPYTDRLIPDDSLKPEIFEDTQNEMKIPVFKRKFAWIMWNETITTDVLFKAIKRGIYSIKDVKLVSGDGFGLSITNQDKKLDEQMNIVVYPKVVDVDTSLFLRNVFDNSSGAKGVYEDLTLLKSNRAYINGDSIKKINWRLLARKNEMQINVYETIMPKSVFFILDLESFGDIQEDDGLFEDMISTVASIIMRLEEGQMKCGIAIPKTSVNEGKVIFPGRTSESGFEILRELSCIDYKNEKTYFDNEEILLNKESLGQIYVCAKDIRSLTCKDLISSIEESATTIIVSESENSEIKIGNKVISIDSIRLEGKQ